MDTPTPMDMDIDVDVDVVTPTEPDNPDGSSSAFAQSATSAGRTSGMDSTSAAAVAIAAVAAAASASASADGATTPTPAFRAMSVYAQQEPRKSVPTPAPSPKPDTMSIDGRSWTGAEGGESIDDDLRNARALFSGLRSDGRHRFLTELLNMCNSYELMAVSAYVAPRLKKDFLRHLPTEISLRILSYINDPRTLARMSQVSKVWHALLNDDLTWKRLCALHRYRRLSVVGSSIGAAAGASAASRASLTVHATDDSPYFSAPEGIEPVVALSAETAARIESVRRASKRPLPSTYKMHFKQRYMIDVGWRAGGTVLARHITDDQATVTWSCLTDEYIVIALDNSRIYVFTRDGRFKTTLEGHASGVWNLDIDGETMCSGGCDKIVRVWNLKTGKTIHQLWGHTSTVRCLEIARIPGEHICVTGSRDNNLRTWDYATGICRHVLVGHTGAVRCLKVHGERVVSGSYDMTCKLWSIRDGTCLRTLPGHTAQIYSIGFDGRTIASGSLDATVRVWEADTGHCRGKLTGHTSLVGQLQMRYPLAVTGGPDGTIRVWNIEEMRCVHHLFGHDNSVTTLQFDDQRIVSGSSDGLTKVWDLQTGQMLRELARPSEQVWRVAFDDDVCVIMSKREQRTCLEVISFFPSEEELRGIDPNAAAPVTASASAGASTVSLASANANVPALPAQLVNEDHDL